MPLDAQVRRLLLRLGAFASTDISCVTVSERRASLSELMRLGAQSVPEVSTQDRSIPGPDSDMTLRLYSPGDASPAVLPGMIFFHGGGFVAGSLQSHDAICRAMTQASGCRVAAVDYRLGPEHPFPAAIEDGVAAARWICAHPADFGMDPDRIGVCGDSAGGTLAAVVCQHLAPCDTPIALQLLICPIMDYAAQSESRREFARGYLLDQATLDHDCRHYLCAGGDASDPRVSPLRAHNLGGVAPTVIHTAQFDPVRDEGAAYANALQRAGVPVTHQCHSGMIHLFYGLGALIPYAETFWRRIGSDIRAHFGHH